MPREPAAETCCRSHPDICSAREDIGRIYRNRRRGGFRQGAGGLDKASAFVMASTDGESGHTGSGAAV